VLRHLFAIAFSALLMVAFPIATQAMDWIIETDMGVDDQISIVYMATKSLSSDAINIKAVLTQGNGMAHAGPAKNNAVRLLRLAGLKSTELPDVGTGSQYGLDGFHQYPADWRYNNDNLSHVSIPDYQEAWKEHNQSSESLLKQHLIRSKRTNQPISILSLGTFTNIAKVLHESPELGGQITQIICMAGAVDVPGNLRVHGFSDQAKNRFAEFNAWIDPIATKMVIESGIPIKLIPLDVTNKASLTKDFLERFKAKTSGEAATAMAEWWQKNLNPETGEYYNWDPLATAIAINPGIITKQKAVKITVQANTTLSQQDGDVIFGEKSDFDILNWKGHTRRSFNPYNAGRTQRSHSGELVNVIFDADIEQYEKELIETFS